MGRVEIERRFLRGEILDNAVYLALAKGEKDRELKAILLKLAHEEEGHIAIWRSLLGDRCKGVGKPPLLELRVLSLMFVKDLLGIAFMTRMLERNEGNAIAGYRKVLDDGSLGPKGRAYLNRIIREEGGHESAMANEVENHRSDLDYTESTILGLNDGLVEILAVIAGLATVATGGLIVAIIGMIAGISGTLSMAGGVYLSSKSENLVKEARGKRGEEEKVQPAKAAYHTGAYYFVGALIAVLPFLVGLSGIEGIATSIILVSVALVIASSIVAITSGTSIRRRSSERFYFGVSI
jgi:VIT1/CCC1 family predicted Fe2+/Mn2+ transporter